MGEIVLVRMVPLRRMEEDVTPWDGKLPLGWHVTWKDDLQETYELASPSGRRSFHYIDTLIPLKAHVEWVWRMHYDELIEEANVT